MTLRARRAALVSLAAVIVLGGASLTGWWLLREPNRAVPGKRVQAVQRKPERISPEELRRYPPIVVLWAATDRGRALVYSLGGDVWTVSPQRVKRTRIFKASAYLVSGTDWTPHGLHVAAGTANGIVKISRDGAKAVKLTRGPDEDPTWSPNGRAIVFTRARGAYGDFHDVYVVRADGQGLRRLVANARAPFWSPNGRSVLFTETKEIEEGVSGSDGRIGVIGSDGRHRRALATGDALAWAPDGRKILFERQTRRGSELWVMDADGKGRRGSGSAAPGGA